MVAISDTLVVTNPSPTDEPVSIEAPEDNNTDPITVTVSGTGKLTIIGLNYHTVHHIRGEVITTLTCLH